MTLLQMKYFVAVCECGSLSLAAKQLFLTQPALSTSITLLEKEYCIKLFERKNNTLILTKEGEFFYDTAKNFLENFASFERDLVDLSHNKTTIRIGVPPMIGSFLFPKIYNQYTQQNPNIKFEIWEDGSLNIRKKIQAKALDLGFSILNDSANEQYEKEMILETELLFCVSKNNKISQLKTVTVEDIKNEPIMMMKEGFFQNRLINNMYNEISEIPKIILVSSQLTVIKNFIKMNAGGAFLMRELLDNLDDGIVGIPFENKLRLNIGIIWQKEGKLDSGAADFIDFLRKNKS